MNTPHLGGQRPPEVAAARRGRFAVLIIGVVAAVCLAPVSAAAQQLLPSPTPTPTLGLGLSLRASPTPTLGLSLLASPTTVSQLPQPSATAVIRDSAGHLIATATFLQSSRTDASLSMVLADPPRLTGAHGVQIHAVGACLGPDFSSAGGIFNPTKKQHGTSNQNGPEVGDLPNLNYTLGLTTYTAAVRGAVFAPGALNSLVGGAGTSVVIYERADDESTQPEGNAGARIACGVIQPGPTSAALQALGTPSMTPALGTSVGLAAPAAQVGVPAQVGLAQPGINVFPTVTPSITPTAATRTATPAISPTPSPTVFRPTPTPTSVGGALTVPGQPAVGQPAVGQPAVGQPAVGQPAVGQPAVGQPAVGQPTVGQPAVGQPAVGQPAVGQPAVGQPAVGQPAVGQPAVQPIAGQSATGPSAPGAFSATPTAGSTLGVGTYRYVLTFATASGETTPGAEVVVPITSGLQTVNLTAIPQGPTGTTARKIYRTALNGTPGSERLVAMLSDNTTTSYTDTAQDSQLGTGLPATDTAGIAPPGAATLGVVGSGSLTGAYRYAITFVNGLTETPGGTESAITVTTSTVQLTTIPLGPVGTTSRKIYRTPAGATTGSERLLATLADNTTTSYNDNTPDASLGAAMPTSSTLGQSLAAQPLPGVPIAAQPATGQGLPGQALPISPLNLATTTPTLPAPGAFAATTSAGSSLSPGTYRYAVTYVTASGETTAGAEVVVPITSGLQTVNLTAVPLGPIGTTARKIYRSPVNGATGSERLATTLNDNTTSSFTDTVQDALLTTALPTVNTAGVPAPGAASVVVAGSGNLNGAYRYAITFLSGTGETTGGVEFATAVSGSTVQLSNIPVGPNGTNARKIYRTPAGGAPGTERLVASLQDNTTTVYNDNTADPSLGPPIPTTNTATPPVGQSLPPITTLAPVSSSGPSALLIAVVIVAILGFAYFFTRSRRRVVRPG